MVKMIFEKYKNFPKQDVVEMNVKYFEALLQKYENAKNIDMTMFDGKNDSNVIPLPILEGEDLELIPVQDYEALNENNLGALKDFRLRLCKMQAGLGTSVKRDDLIQKYSKRTSLGSKGTDLFIEYEGNILPIAEVQLLQAELIQEEGYLAGVSLVNLINQETEEAVNEIWNKVHPKHGKTYTEIFSTEKLKGEKNINQLMMPTISEEGKLTFEREAPSGHAFLGFHELVKLFEADSVENEITCIGNGEDLRSNPDKKILSWMVRENIPAVMITTTKLEKDKKGGQIALVKDHRPYVAIVEKAQAEKANQLEFFEELGLRSGDNRSLFNTNIVLLNHKVLKERFNRLEISVEKFQGILAPDLIKNVKEQDGKKFTQLEGAIGSTLLNLDKYYRQTFSNPLIHFLNLAPENRESFFLPIKKREDFDGIYG